MGLAACTGTTTGNGSPFPSATTGAQPSATGSGGGQGGTTSDSGTRSGGSWIADTKPCSLLSSAEVTSLSLQAPGSADNIGSAPSCEWTGSAGVLTVSLRASQGLAQVQPGGGTVSDTTVSGRAAKKVSYSSGDCLIALPVTDSSRVDVTGSFSDSATSCTQILAAAELIEPKLPTS
ncbi:MAG TPA: DUF3558 family protein [Pseudonocardiaceae bacterium]|nr:DUF3558 family protein [Pseudonocardiaceae bacterium]